VLCLGSQACSSQSAGKSTQSWTHADLDIKLGDEHTTYLGCDRKSHDRPSWILWRPKLYQESQKCLAFDKVSKFLTLSGITHILQATFLVAPDVSPQNTLLDRGTILRYRRLILFRQRSSRSWLQVTKPSGVFQYNKLDASYITIEGSFPLCSMNTEAKRGWSCLESTLVRILVSSKRVLSVSAPGMLPGWLIEQSSWSVVP